MFDLIITPEGGEPIALTADSRDVYMWERTGKDRTLQQLTKDLRITECYALAHITARRLELPAGELKLEDFVARYLLDFPDDEDSDSDPDPTQPAH